MSQDVRKRLGWGTGLISPTRRLRLWLRLVPALDLAFIVKIDQLDIVANVLFKLAIFMLKCPPIILHHL